MCVGGLLALCTPVSASESISGTPVNKEISREKSDRQVENTESALPEDNRVTESNNNDPDPDKWPAPGGYIVISGLGLLLLIILLIILL